MANQSGWNRYTIMHKEQKVACVHKNGKCVIYKKSLMPYNLYLEDAENDDIDERLNNLQNFYYWCASRMLTLDRKYAKEILNTLGKKQAVTDRDRAEISISYHCLSLTDVYWVKSFREKATFSDINLYEHSLAKAFVDVCLSGMELTLQNAELLTQNDVAGDVATVGVAPKAWVRRGDTFYLLKDGDERDVEAELLASKILDCFDVPHVQYFKEEYNGKTVSVSKIISSPEKSLVSAEYIDIYAINHDTDLHSIAHEKSWKSYHMMLIVDYLVGNSDRHWGNWGFFVDNKTNKLLELYPLMDFNKAFTNYSGLAGGLCLPEGAVKTQQDAAVQAVRNVGLNQIKEVDPDWFINSEHRKVFFDRLNYLKAFDKK